MKRNKILVCAIFMTFSVSIKAMTNNEEYEKKYIDWATGRHIVSVDACDNIIKLVMTEDDPLQGTVLHLYQHNKEGDVCYFSPFLKNSDTCDVEEFKKLSNQYALFDAAAAGDYALFNQALAKGADLAEKDLRAMSILLAFQQNNGTLCSFEDLLAGNFKTLTKAPCSFFGPNIYQWSVGEHVVSSPSMKIWQALYEKMPSFFNIPQTEWEERIKKREESSLKIIEAQEKSAIPTFALESNCDFLQQEQFGLLIVM